MIKILKENFLWIKRELQDDEVIVWIGQFPSSCIIKPTYDINSLWYFLFSTLILQFFIPLAYAIILSILFLIFHSSPKINGIYIITNSRVILLPNTQLRKFISYYPHQLSNFEQQQNADGSGHIIFRTELCGRNLYNPPTNEPGLMNIKNVARVGDLLEKLNQSSPQYNRQYNT